MFVLDEEDINTELDYERVGAEFAVISIVGLTLPKMIKVKGKIGVLR